jgi:DNA replication protein DnaC
MSRPKKTDPPTPREALHALLQELNFKGMARVLDSELDRAERHGISGVELVQRLLSEQASFERERSLINRVAHARLPWPWTIDTFPFERQSGVNKAQILGLADLEFVRRAENLVLIGGTGTGKTGIALGLLRQACVNGWRGRFYNAQTLLDELYASLADRTTTKLLTSLSRMQPLCVDELSYLSLKPEQVNAFFRLMDQRYGRVSTIITSNCDYPQWYELFNNKPLVDALLDRLQHHCITIRIEGPSLRSNALVNAQSATPSPSPSPTTKSQALRKAK